MSDKTLHDKIAEVIRHHNNSTGEKVNYVSVDLVDLVDGSSIIKNVEIATEKRI